MSSYGRRGRYGRKLGRCRECRNVMVEGDPYQMMRAHKPSCQLGRAQRHVYSHKFRLAIWEHDPRLRGLWMRIKYTFKLSWWEAQS